MGLGEHVLVEQESTFSTFNRYIRTAPCIPPNTLNFEGEFPRKCRGSAPYRRLHVTPEPSGNGAQFQATRQLCIVRDGRRCGETTRSFAACSWSRSFPLPGSGNANDPLPSSGRSQQLSRRHLDVELSSRGIIIVSLHH